jgi:hypothetical protein
MSFVFPYFLAALSLIAIPVIIHLFNFRRYKTVYFTNVRFLKEVNDETTNRSKLKYYLVLASRILAFIFLVLAFAQPFIPVSEAGAKQAANNLVSIYLDNSFSMNAASEAGTGFQQAKQKVYDILNAYGQNDKFQLVTNDFEPRQQRMLSKDDVKEILDEVQLSPVVKSLDEVQNFQMKLLNTYDGQKIIYWLTDFQRNISDVNTDTLVQYFLLPLQPVQQQNIFIDSCWLEKPVLFVNEPNRFLFRVSNIAEQDVDNIKVNLSINGQVKALSDINVPAKSFAIDTLSFSIQEYGWQQLKVFLNDFPITFDDSYYLCFKTNEQIKVLAVNGQEENNFLKALFAQQEHYILDQSYAAGIDSMKMSSYNLVVLNNIDVITPLLSGALERYLKNGGSVLLFPSANADLTSYNKFFTLTGANDMSMKTESPNEVIYLNTENELFADVFEKVPQNMSLPQVKVYYHFIKKTRSSEQIILGLKNNASFLSQYNFQNGRLVVCASPLGKDYSDFPVHAVFVPLVYKMAVTTSTPVKISYILGKDYQIEIADNHPISDAVYKLKNQNSEWIPGQRSMTNKVYLNLDQQFTEAGFYEVVNEKKQRSEFVALNFNRQESQLDCFTKEELKEKFTGNNIKLLDATNTNLSATITELSKGMALWKVCIILALIFLASEVLLLRFLR